MYIISISSVVGLCLPHNRTVLNKGSNPGEVTPVTRSLAALSKLLLTTIISIGASLNSARETYME